MVAEIGQVLTLRKLAMLELIECPPKFGARINGAIVMQRHRHKQRGGPKDECPSVQIAAGVDQPGHVPDSKLC